jgi:hypothetical protein
LERGRTSADRRQVFTLSGIWTVNYLQNSSSAWKRGLLNDWTVSAIVTLQSGAPLTITSGQDRNLDGLTTDRADLIGNPVLSSGRARTDQVLAWFNTAAFAQPALGTDGNAGRNILDGPGYRNVDLGVFRDIRLGGPILLQLRLETTNLFNFVNLSNPDTSLNAPTTFGQIRSARDVRRVQLGGRLSF